MDNEQYIWNRLLTEYKNPFGVAALMGNLYVESKLISCYLESSKARKLGLTSEEYVNKVDCGVITQEQFKNDGAGFGLAQWTYSVRKDNLYKYAESTGTSIGDLDMQLEFLIEELKTYKTVNSAIKNAKNIRECSDIIVRRYERPANQTEKFLQNRADYGVKIYSKYGEKKEPVVHLVTATSTVNVRSGNGKEYGIVGSLAKGNSLEYVTELDGWYAVKFIKGKTKSVSWISKEFSKLS